MKYPCKHCGKKFTSAGIPSHTRWCKVRGRPLEFNANAYLVSDNGNDVSVVSGEFDAAKAIATALVGLNQEQQRRAIRWAAESLEMAT